MNHTKEHYLSLGMDEKAADYFVEGRRTLESATANPDFTLSLFYRNEEERILDMNPLIQKGGVFSFLADFLHFSRVYVDDCHSVCWDKDPSVDSNVVWDNQVDLCPDTCFMDSVPVSLQKEKSPS